MRSLELQLSHRIQRMLGIKKINVILLMDFIFLTLCSPFLIYLIYGSSYEMWGYFNIFIFPIYGGVIGMAAFIIYLLPRKIRKIVLWLLLLAIHCYLFFYMYVFWVFWKFF